MERNKETKQQLSELCENTFIEVLFKLGIDPLCIRQFFEDVIKLQEGTKAMLETVEINDLSGVSLSLFIRNKALAEATMQRSLERTKRKLAQQRSRLFKTCFLSPSRIKSPVFDSVRYQPLKRGLLSFKKYKDLRDCIRLVSIQLFLFGDQMKREDVQSFRSEEVPYWRSCMEVLRTEFHLQKKPLPRHLYEANLYLKVLETSN